MRVLCGYYNPCRKWGTVRDRGVLVEDRVGLKEAVCVCACAHTEDYLILDQRWPRRPH